MDGHKGSTLVSQRLLSGNGPTYVSGWAISTKKQGGTRLNVDGIPRNADQLVAFEEKILMMLSWTTEHVVDESLNGINFLKIHGSTKLLWGNRALRKNDQFFSQMCCVIGYSQSWKVRGLNMLRRLSMSMGVMLWRVDLLHQNFGCRIYDIIKLCNLVCRSLLTNHVAKPRITTVVHCSKHRSGYVDKLGQNWQP